MTRTPRSQQFCKGGHCSVEAITVGDSFITGVILYPNHRMPYLPNEAYSSLELT